MLLSRAQCLCIWNIASEHAIGAEFEISSPDNNGAIIVMAHSTLLHSKATYRVPREGGRERLTPPDPPLKVPEEA
jgi:hypothetical protein